MNLGIWADGGFVGDNGGPEKNAPRDWIVWHFTLLEYLPELVASGALLCDDQVPERVGSVANQSVKELRRKKLVAADDYPLGRAVSAHVPWYFAAKSPMLFVVRKNEPPAKLDSLVFLGMKIGDAVDAGLEWAASDGNAATGITSFSTRVEQLGSFVDFDLLKAKWWNEIPEDRDRMRRRAAEFLVHDRVPLNLLSQVVARNSATLEVARTTLSGVGHPDIEFRSTSVFFD